MARRKRTRAENAAIYARRNERAKAKYGVSYSQQEGIVRKARATDGSELSRQNIYELMSKLKDVADKPVAGIVKDMLDRRQTAHDLREAEEDIPPDLYDFQDDYPDIDIDEIWIHYH